MFLTITMLLYCTADAVLAIWLTLTYSAGWTWMIIANAIMVGFWICTLLAQLEQRSAKAPKHTSGTTGPGKCAKETTGKPNPDAALKESIKATPGKSNPNDLKGCIKTIPGTDRIDVPATLEAVDGRIDWGVKG